MIALRKQGMDDLPRMSVVIPTRDRPDDLAELLFTIFNQTLSPVEVIIVDDSLVGSAKKIVESLGSKSKTNNCRLAYIQGNGDGLPAARNLGARLSNGDAVLFIDDDTLLTNNLLYALSAFLMDHPKAMGVQPQIHTLLASHSGNISSFENAVYRSLMLSYSKQNTLAVRRSGASIFPYCYRLTEEISAQRLDGCCMCYRRRLFDKLNFDTNLRKWASMEDLDFSLRVCKEYGVTLYAIPHSAIIHKKSTKPEISSRTNTYMVTLYWFYVFFKDVFKGSILNLIAFLWALTGNLVSNVGGLIIKRKQKNEWWGLIYLLKSYVAALRNLKNMRMLKLEFFNKNLGAA
jgi:GT2 family glycosyltransferase